MRLGKTEEYCRNTAYVLFDLLTYPEVSDDFFRLVSDLSADTQLVLDPVEEPLIRALSFVSDVRGTKSEISRIKGRLDASFRGIDAPHLWSDSGAAKRVVHMIGRTRTSLASKSKGAFSSARSAQRA